MMLDAKRTFDELVERNAPDAADPRRRAREPDLPRAVERGRRLAGVHGDGEAPRAAPGRPLRPARARHAADAQRARLPRRAAAALTRFIDSRSLQFFRRVRPAGPRHRRPRHGRRVLAARSARPASTCCPIWPTSSTRSATCPTGFRERARKVEALLGDSRTTFLLVTSPRTAAIDEAEWFHRKLSDQGLPFGGVIVNRMHARRWPRAPLGGPDAASSASHWPRRWRARLEDQALLAERDAHNLEVLRAEARPQADDRRPGAGRGRARPGWARRDARAPVQRSASRQARAQTGAE